MERKLTPKIVADAEAEGGKERLYMDAAMPGFGLRVRPSGAKSFVILYRRKRLHVGSWPRLTLPKAREAARKILAEVELGADPLEERRKKRRGQTIAELAKRYQSEACGDKKPRSLEADQHILKKYILPKFGALKITEFSAKDVKRLHRSMRAKPYMYNRVRALLSSLMSFAADEELLPEGFNPVRGTPRYKEHKRKRFLSQDELARLGAALAKSDERPSVIAAVQLLLLTGCRKQEILKLRWREVNFEARELRLEESKSGAKTVQLNAPAMTILVGLRPSGDVSGDAPVLEGRHHGKPLENIQRPWVRICETAKIADCRVHDLRHTHGSVAAGAGESLLSIAKLLGHAQTSTTERYSHLDDNPWKRASERVGAKIAALMGGKDADVLELRP